MGEGTNRVETQPSADEVGERVERSRNRLDHLVSELDQRRHVVTDAKRVLSDHPLYAVAGGLAVVGLIGGAIVLVVQHQRERALLSSRVSRLRQALARMIDNPQRVAPAGSTIPGKLLAAAGSAATTLLVKRMLENVVQPAADTRKA
jgi:hypothetical protein